MNQQQARQLVAAAVLEAIDEKFDAILSNHHENEQRILEDVLDDLREDILQFGEANGLSDEEFEELLRSAPVSTPDDEMLF